MAKAIPYILDPEIKKQLDALPNLNMQLLQERTDEEQENENVNYIESVISDVGISEIPSDLLSPEEEMEWFIKSELIKPNTTYDEEVIADL